MLTCFWTHLTQVRVPEVLYVLNSHYLILKTIFFIHTSFHVTDENRCMLFYTDLPLPNFYLVLLNLLGVGSINFSLFRVNPLV